MNNAWVSIRLIVLLIFLFAVPLVFVFRAMGRQIRADYRFGREARTRGYENLATKFLVIGVGIGAVALITRQWVGLGFCVFILSFSATVWLNKPTADGSFRLGQSPSAPNRQHGSDNYSWVARHPSLILALLFATAIIGLGSFLYDFADALRSHHWGTALAGCLALLACLLSAYSAQRSRAVVRTKRTD